MTFTQMAHIFNYTYEANLFNYLSLLTFLQKCDTPSFYFLYVIFQILVVL